MKVTGRTAAIVITIVAIVSVAITAGIWFISGDNGKSSAQQTNSQPKTQPTSKPLFKQPQYKPTIGEQPLFRQLRPATSDEASAAIRAIKLSPTANHDLTDVYMANAPELTTMTVMHPMAIVINPGTTWDGPLGLITLVTRVSDAELSQHDKAFRDLVLHDHSWYNVIYDPICRAYQLGVATEQVCRANHAERGLMAKGTMADHLKPLDYLRDDSRNDTSPEKNLLEQLPQLGGEGGGPTPYIPTSDLALNPGQVKDDNPMGIGVVMRGGFKITGGDFGSMTIFLPTTAQSGPYTGKFQPIVDPIMNNLAAGVDRGACSYFRGSVLRYYAAACQAMHK